MAIWHGVFLYNSTQHSVCCQNGTPLLYTFFGLCDIYIKLVKCREMERGRRRRRRRCGIECMDYIHNNHIVNGSGDEMKMFNGVNESRNYLFIQSAKGEKFFFLFFFSLLLFPFNGDNIKVLRGYIFKDR